MINSYSLNLSGIQLTSFIFGLILLNSAQAEWKSGVELPEQSKWNGQSDIFNPITIANNRLTYVAATSTNPISWKIQKGESAYLLIYLPPGVEKLNMGVNGQALAASQLVMFKDFGEMSCNNITEPASPQLSEFLNNKSELHVTLPTGWLALGDSRTAAHERDKEFINTSSCLFFGFFNANNLNQNGVQLQTVSFTYTISDLSVYEQWAAGNNKLTVNSENGKVTITNNLNTDSKVCPDDCTPTDYPADTVVTLQAVANDGYAFQAWGDDCKDQAGDNITIKMDTSKTCSALFELKPVTLIVDPAPDNGIVITYFTNDITCGNNKEDLKLICSNRTEDLKQLCSATYSLNSQAILVAVPDMGFTLVNWGGDCSSEKTESYVILKMDDNKKCSATFTK
ncbi:InlB B-repeat-containing protein [Candidatus Marithrix sp. Canyon 246]|uniref:InlB B-repeat-containing protein n=1 Tax=Candidatus Marithrix sp. Canyon 246 TaxID=1827136 RepID=UPI00114CF594|nr:hypothetical protein [Candidatus Marithrix sp. Canyon 246]